MKPDSIVVLRTFENAGEANLVKSKLLSYGIPCFLSDENTVTLYPLFNQALGGIRLNIFYRDKEEAMRIIDEEPDEIDPNNEHSLLLEKDCIVRPYCGSDNVRYGTATEKKFRWITIIISLILTIYPFVIRRAYHCFACHKDFKK
ncbi:DUF2007 domain-containing protein [Coprobacter tertius]|uniref:DUF2007 domain-containing protein n=1 Tax=Coprobacter tertius TaxID=2944915 RepID=A0ABT1MJ65_9BACT|nr:DUF2007 domain-containing protein [Coprobacter tertius]MCP9611738.1 DUF2007 domain-containing protein [Coprobacter tertius]